MTKKMTEQEKWNRRIKVDEKGCHLWIKYRNPNGYGQTRIGGRKGYNILAHRLAWLREHGFIPDGLDVLHHCDTPACVNVAHLFVGTAADNMRDMSIKGRWGVRNLPSGKEHHRATAKLTEKDVLEIRKDLRTNAVVAAIYRVDPSCISLIRSRRTWNHV